MAQAKTAKQEFLATGRRKKSVARVRLTPNGKGNIIINKKPINEYFALDTFAIIATQALTLTGLNKKVDVKVTVNGGGHNGQAGAIRLGITRALVKMDESLKPELKKAGFLTRDSRMKERKKYGLKKARKSPQFSKR